ncbi:protein FAF-like, chloroplastic [Papaver somniferum]|uniref:protein FAF-like, chloroplastic n=1 Tax=Papaver somniferum TaxID=3469 RepID=UPI000E6F7B0B|nr:protein FAF-like, chloroplastic [Papaver somniferum]
MSGGTTCVKQVSLSEQPFQGFVCETTTNSSATANSLRRTLSAVDMSFKIADDQDVERKNGFSQQQQQQPGGQLDIWSSILIQKPSSLPSPYVHPLVKSKSCLSIKSLEICTENLGSESGSDGYPHSDSSLYDTEEEEIEAIEQPDLVEQKKEVVIMKYSNKSLLPPSSVRRSFPPPLKSLSKPAGEGIQMKTLRKDGRLILEAVPVPTSTNCFNAQRQDGRLVLKFATPIPESKSESFDDKEDIFETSNEEVDLQCSHDIEIEEQEEGNKGIVLEMTPKLPTGVINVHRSVLMVNNFTGLTNNRNNWSSSSNLKNKLEKMTNSPSVELLPQSLPISPATLAAVGAPRMSSSRLIPEQQTAEADTAVEPSFNRYEYGWRTDTTSSVVSAISRIHLLLDQQPDNKDTYHNNNNSNTLVRSKNSYYVKNNNDSLFVKDSTTTKGANYKEEKQNGHGEKVVDQHLIVPAYCKLEPRRSVVFWEPPFCIATS